MWALGEIACAVVTLLTLAVTVVVIAVDPFFDIPWALRGWPMQLLLAGAVGYGTNFVAVQMLFKPRKPWTWIPMRWIWRQGLIPAKQTEMAQIVGEEVAKRLLTAETVVDEIARLIEVALEDKETFEELRVAIEKTLSREMPELLKRFLPEALDAVEHAMQESLPPSELKRVLLQIIDEWFAEPRHRHTLASFLQGLVRSWAYEIVMLFRHTTKRYKKTDTFRMLAITAGRSTKIVHWGDFERALIRQIDTDKGYRWAMNLVERFGKEVHVFAERVIRVELLEETKKRTGRIALDSVAQAAEHSLVPRLMELVQSESFKKFIIEDLIPRSKPKVVGWIKAGHLTPFFEQFDVKGRVAKAAAALDVAELEDMANNVGAYHLAAIQVLGYVLGLVVGVLGAWLGATS